MKKSYLSGAICASVLTLSMTNPANSAALYSNGFETDAAGWDVFGGTYDATRVASGTNGITSATGGWHAESSGSGDGSASNWGGYNFGSGSPVAFQEYTTSIDIFLDVSGAVANEARFDYSSAINNTTGSHRRDFIFNAGFYDSTDNDAPGAGTNRFIISASNNANSGVGIPKQANQNPIAIDTTGWYTFEHHFYDNAGVLNVDLSILGAGGALINTWTRSNPTDLTASVVGGNRYALFNNYTYGVLAFDNASLETAAVPVPATLALFSIGLAGLSWSRRRKA